MAINKALLLPLVLLLSFVTGPGWLGIRLSEQGDRPVIAEVIPGSPADKAKIKIGDAILAIGDTRTRTVDDVYDAFQKLNAGDRIRIQIQRGKSKLGIDVRLVARPEADAERRKAAVDRRAPKPVRGQGYLGLGLEETADGVRVYEVAAKGPGAKAGVRVGDRILGMGRTRVRTMDDLDTAMKKLRAGDKMRMQIRRGDRRRGLQFVVGARPGAKAPAKPLAEASRAARPKADRRAGAKRRRDSRDQPRKARPRKAQPKKAQPKKAQPDRRAVTEPKKQARSAFRVSSDLSKSLVIAKKRGRPVMLVFGATWCVNCETLKKSLQHASLQRSLARYECVWIDTDRQSKLADEYDVESLPHVVFLTKDGAKRRTMVGYQPPELLRPVLAAGLPKSAARDRRPTKRAVSRAKPLAKPDRVAKPKGKVTEKPARRDRPRRAAQPRRGARDNNNAATREIRTLRNQVKRLAEEQRKQGKLLRQILDELKRRKD